VDLPTYTNIWRIEKRLYKLYDVRLPMPLPINWIVVFAGITIPYIILLIAIGLPFNHSLVWLYVLPPGVLTWLTTRPVIENKRLPELVESQARYLMEPRTWVRLAPLSEKDQVILTARVWRSRPPRRPARLAPVKRPVPASRGELAPMEPARESRPMRTGPVLRPTSVFRPDPAAAQGPVVRQRERSGSPERGRAQERSRATAAGRDAARRAPALPAARLLPPVTPVTAPGATGLPGSLFGPVPHPGHPGGRQRENSRAPALPDVVPAAAPPLSQPDPVLPPVYVSPPAAMAPPAPAQPPRPARVVVPVPTAKPDQPPVRIRAGAPGGASLELSHDGPGRRPAPAGQPAEPGASRAAPVWPSQPLRTPPSAPPVTPTAAGTSATLDAPPSAERPAPAPSAGARQPAPSAAPAPPVSLVRPGPAAPLTPSFSPADPAHGWPAAPRPLRPVPPAAAAAAPPAGEDHPAAAAAPPPAEALAAPADTPPAPAGTPALADTPPAPQETPAPAQAPPATSVVQAPAPAQAPPVAAPAPVPVAQPAAEPKQQAVPSLERALSGPGRDRNSSWGGKVKVVTGNGAAQGPGARDQEAQDRNRARLPLADPRRILVLGCTSGAGQSVTAYMTAFMLASLREQPVAAVDLHDGTLARFRAPAAWLEELLAGKPPQHIVSGRPDGLHPSPRPTPGRLDVVASHEALSDGDELKLAVQLNRHYPLTVLDPGAAGLTRLLKVTDQLVVVVPANGDAAGALADTRDWLDNNGHADLAMQSVTVINGVSRRSLTDVEQAESVARGRSRAIVRVPWDDMLPVAAAGPSSLRPQTRVAYTALSGVLVAGLAAAPGRKKP
jgi:hypothetical protein